MAKPPLYLYILPFQCNILLFILARFSLAIHYFHIFIFLPMSGLLLLALESPDLPLDTQLTNIPALLSTMALQLLSPLHLAFTLICARCVCPRHIDMPLRGCSTFFWRSFSPVLPH